MFLSMCRQACVSIQSHDSVCVPACVQVGICALWHLCPQHGAMEGQLEAQSVKGVCISVVGGPPNPQ